MAERDRLEKWKRHRDVIMSYDVVNRYVLLAVIDQGSQDLWRRGNVIVTSPRCDVIYCNLLLAMIDLGPQKDIGRESGRDVIM